MMHRETIGFYFQIHMEHINTIWTNCSIGSIYAGGKCFVQ